MDRKTYIEGLEREKAGYEARDNSERAGEVEKEIARVKREGITPPPQLRNRREKAAVNQRGDTAVQTPPS